MKAKLVKIEDRLAVFVPNELAESGRLQEGDEVDLTVVDAAEDDRRGVAARIMAKRYSALRELAK